MNAKHLVKLVGVSSLLLATSTAQAWTGNFLLGVEGGYAWRDAQRNVVETDNDAPFTVLGYSSPHDDSGFIWGFLGGYQVKCNKVLLGLEANVSWQDVGETRFDPVVYGAQIFPASTEHERGTVVGLSFRAGYQLLDWLMPYVRAGAETSDETVKFSLTLADGTPQYNTEESRRAVRFIGGAGVEMPLYLQSVLRLEYLYSSRGRGGAANQVIPDSSLHVNVKPNQHAAKIAFVWNFI